MIWCVHHTSLNTIWIQQVMVFGLEFYEIHALDKVSEEDVKDKMNCVVVGFIVS